ncbi:U1 small nuclear ribonucleoprotein subunit [Entamoeba histolytica HM-3:IMSS]|uniref:U1 small nuclear ribonucleoprotein subunit, putative n=2 Tax=Entamoeba histolytica TaxID=5759 RepID=M2S1Z3_ENTHI|nr:U1 small nuclear ribonucleoprotein subunit, putative [Entamoeba histolytica KU27]EMS12573.1 U1 small nuclear ribonucleoprotein subunit [Entamoeba histolytica HM-3:IMSS]
MVCLLPKNFAALFVPDEPIRFLPPVEKHWFPNYSGVSSYLTMFDELTPNNEKKTEEIDSFAPTWTKSGLRELRFLKTKEEKAQSLRTQIQTCLFFVLLIYFIRFRTTIDLHSMK